MAQNLGELHGDTIDLLHLEVAYPFGAAAMLGATLPLISHLGIEPDTTGFDGSLKRAQTIGDLAR